MTLHPCVPVFLAPGDRPARPWWRRPTVADLRPGDTFRWERRGPVRLVLAVDHGLYVAGLTTRDAHPAGRGTYTAVRGLNERVHDHHTGPLAPNPGSRP